MVDDGGVLDCDLMSLDTGAFTHRRHLPNAAEHALFVGLIEGFVLTRSNLQSTSHADVFAVGDVATRSDTRHARSGVCAVRAGPPLALNLRHAVAGPALQPHQAPSSTLSLASCGERTAIAASGTWSAQGRWVWWLKEPIDRSFVARYVGPAASLSIKAGWNR